MAVDFVSLRRKMVDNQIRTVDVTDLGVLAAFLDVAREDFVAQTKRDFAYLDSDIVLPLSQNSTTPRSLMRPAALARLAQLAQIGKQDKILNVGGTSGYGAAILSKLAAQVVMLECDEDLSLQARDILHNQGITHVEVVCGPLEEGYKERAPYDVILCEGAADFVPEMLLAQLGEDGRLVIVEGHGLAGEAKLYIREKAGISARSAFNLSLAPLPGFQKKPGFIF